jgi:hypothetical protein
MLFYSMSKILQARNFGGIFFAVTFGMLGVHTAFGSEQYFALVGPPPMRFQAAPAKDPVFMAELALPGSVPTNAPDVAATSAATNSPVAKANPPQIPATVKSPVHYSATAYTAPIPASNLLGINPWMITQYLTPYQNNGAAPGWGSYQPGDAIFIPEESGFVPPMPGSRAIYNSQ